MRYTTILDLRDWPALYKNHNVRLVYLHLVLIAGYHDDNRDKACISLRQLSADVGLTLSTIRHALEVLERTRIIKRTSNGIMVAKWLKEATITPRQRKRVGTITTDDQPTEKKLSSMEKLQQRAAAGDQQAEQLLKRYFLK